MAVKSFKRLALLRAHGAATKKRRVQGDPSSIEPPSPKTSLVWGMEELKMAQYFPIYGDGNCAFRAVAQWLRDPLRTSRYVRSNGLPYYQKDKDLEVKLAGEWRE